MSFLLDTHAFLWFALDEPKLTKEIAYQIKNPSNTIFISIASIWELAIKFSLGKLEIDQSFDDLLTLIKENNFDFLPITSEHTIISNEEINHWEHGVHGDSKLIQKRKFTLLN